MKLIVTAAFAVLIAAMWFDGLADLAEAGDENIPGQVAEDGDTFSHTTTAPPDDHHDHQHDGTWCHQTDLRDHDGDGQADMEPCTPEQEEYWGGRLQELHEPDRTEVAP